MAFPRFENGDVEIRFGTAEEPWVLESSHLAQHSPWFKASLSQQWSSDSAADGEAPGRRIYGLLFQKGNDEGTLMRQWSDETIGIGGDTNAPDEARTTEAKALLKYRELNLEAHQLMLKIIYHTEPLAKPSCLPSYPILAVLGKLADFYGCSTEVNLRIELFLQRHRDTVLGDCGKDPVAMLELGLAVQSTWVSIECCTHIVAAGDGEYKPMREKVHSLGMAGILDSKRKIVKEILQSIDIQLLRLSVISPGPGSREFDYDEFLASSLWRQWLVDQMDSGLPYGRMYRKNGAGGDVFKFPSSSRSILAGRERKPELRRNLAPIVKRAQQIVKPVLEDMLQWLPKFRSQDAEDYLTFETINESDLPWNTEDGV